MKREYCFAYSERQTISLKYKPLIPALVVAIIMMLSEMFLPVLIRALSTSKIFDFYPTIYFLGAWSVLAFLPFIALAVYCELFHYNTSITYVHWYFNQTIEICGNKLTVNQSNGQDEFQEELHINKIKKRRYAVYYYETHHRYVAIPIEVINEQEKR